MKMLLTKLVTLIFFQLSNSSEVGRMFQYKFEKEYTKDLQSDVQQGLMNCVRLA